MEKAELTKRDIELIKKVQREEGIALVLDTIDSDWLRDTREEKKGK